MCGLVLLELNGEGYLQFLQEHFNGLLEDVLLDNRRRMWYMHDGAPSHINRLVRHRSMRTCFMAT